MLSTHIFKVKSKGKEVTVHSFLTLGLDESEWSTSPPPAALPPVLIKWEAGWAPETVWTFGEREILLSLPGYEPQIVHPVA
jgi:hypothetical protein